MGKIKAVIFDIDGTLVDSVGVAYRAFNQGINKFGLNPVAKEELAKMLNSGFSLSKIISTLYPERAEEGFLEQCQKVILNGFIESNQQDLILFPRVREVFNRLKAKGIKIGIATGRMTPAEDERKRFEEMRLSEFIDAIVTPLEVGNRKPEPHGLLECARRLGISPEECVTVGDAEIDIIAGKRAGMITFAVLTGVGKLASLEKEEPTAILNNLEGLLALV